MASAHLDSGFDFPPHLETHQGILSSPAASPRIHRLASQESLHMMPGGSFSSSQNHAVAGQAFPSYPASIPQSMRTYQPLMSPHQGYMSTIPTSAPPMQTWSSGGTMYNPRGSHAMIRTISHAHPMKSATEHTTSSRYSASPHSAVAPGCHDTPLSASMYVVQTASYNARGADQHLNPTLFDANNYPMSRSTSGASDAAADTHRLLTPHLEYNGDHLNSAEQELRKYSDSLGRSSSRFYPGAYAPTFDVQSQGLGPHPQPETTFFGRKFPNEHFALSDERDENKPDILSFHADTEYERERAANMLNNKKLLDDVGLGAAGNSVSRLTGLHCSGIDEYFSLSGPAT